MGFNAPTVRGPLAPGAWDAMQAAAPNAEGYNAALTARIQQLPSYQAWVRSLSAPGLHASGVGVGGTAEWKALMSDLQRQGVNIPENEMLDGQTGTVRGKSWMERHPVLGAVLITAGFAGGGAALGAALGAGGAAAGAGAGAGAGSTSAAAGAGAGVGIGETAATTGLDAAWASGATAGLGPTTAGSMAATDAALAGGTVPASLGGAGAMPTVAGAGSSSLLTKYLIPAAGQGIEDYLQQRNNDANREQSLQVAQQGVAYDQSKQDPFRAQMHQANDVGRLERMATPPPTYASTGPYASYMGPSRTPTLSSDYLNTVRGAQGQIARGQNPMPNMVDPANWGKTNAQDFSVPPAAPMQPASVSTQPMARRVLPTDPNQLDDPNNPYAGMSLASLLARTSRRGLSGGINA